MTKILKLAAAPAMIAALSLSATPSLAADFAVPAVPSSVAPAKTWDTGMSSDYHRRYRYRRNRVDAGDILTGVLIIGGIAAIANAAKRGDDRRRDDYRYRDVRYRDADVRGIDRAVSRCVSEIERDVRVDSVDSVDRDASGWRVGGTLYNGDAFACRIGSDGRIDDIDFSDRRVRYDEDHRGGSWGAPASYQRVEDNQYSDDRYRSAWADIDAGPDIASTSVPASDQGGAAYPGGPIDGDLD